MSEVGKITLHYDAVRVVPWFRRRRVRQVAACAAAAVMLWWISKWAPPTWERAKFLRLQNQVAAFQIQSAEPLLPAPQTTGRFCRHCARSTILVVLAPNTARLPDRCFRHAAVHAPHGHVERRRSHRRDLRDP